MLIAMPDWYAKIEEKLREAILDVVRKENIPIALYSDSKRLVFDSAVKRIADRLYFISGFEDAAASHVCDFCQKSFNTRTKKPKGGKSGR